jgi:hypothetical protein
VAGKFRSPEHPAIPVPDWNPQEECEVTGGETKSIASSFYGTELFVFAAIKERKE